MTEDPQETSTETSAPGSGAGDPAPTQAIPRIAKAPSAKKSPAKKNGAPVKPAAKKAPSAGSQTDKGRPRETPAPAPVPATERSTAAERTTTPPRATEPIGGPKGHPLTASDYARTTGRSPAATSVIPAVKEPVGTQDADRPAAGAGRRASLRLTHVEPWSVTRLAFAISVALMVVAVVAAVVFWVVLDFVGVWDQINDSFTSVLSDNSSSFDVKDYFGFGRVVGLTLVLSAVNVVIATALATIGAHLYNLAAQLMGGVEVTFTEQK